VVFLSAQGLTIDQLILKVALLSLCLPLLHYLHSRSFLVEWHYGEFRKFWLFIIQGIVSSAIITIMMLSQSGIDDASISFYLMAAVAVGLDDILCCLKCVRSLSSFVLPLQTHSNQITRTFCQLTSFQLVQNHLPKWFTNTFSIQL
jgi:hypothetical protein